MLRDNEPVIREIKYIIFLMSITPLVISVKFVIKLNEAIVSNKVCGVQPEKKFKTIGIPLTVNIKQIAIPTTNAIT